MSKICGENEADEVLATLAAGFIADPFMRWLYPEARTFLTHFPTVMTHFGGRAFARRTAYRDDGYRSAALWLPPGVHPDEDNLVKCFEATVAPQKIGPLFATFELMDAFHPEDDIWHLAFIATDPARQGKGFGAALMRECLAACDADGRPAYLESTNAANLPFYERFGFKQIGVIEANGAPPLFPMYRAQK